MSQFTFPQREWAAVFEAGSRAEAAVYSDPRTACFYCATLTEMEPISASHENWLVLKHFRVASEANLCQKKWSVFLTRYGVIFKCNLLILN
jgi:hypothetical protein